MYIHLYTKLIVWTTQTLLLLQYLDFCCNFLVYRPQVLDLLPFIIIIIILFFRWHFYLLLPTCIVFLLYLKYSSFTFCCFLLVRFITRFITRFTCVHLMVIDNARAPIHTNKKLHLLTSACMHTYIHMHMFISISRPTSIL